MKDLPGIFLVALTLAGFFLGLRKGMAILILLRPLGDRFFELTRTEFLGSEISVGALLNVIVIGVAVLNAPRIWHSVPRALRFAWIPFLIVTFVAVLYSPVQINALRKFVTYITLAIMFMIPFAVVRSEDDVRYYVRMLLLSSVLPVLYGLVQMIFGVDLFGVGGDRIGIESTFGHPGLFGFYLMLTIATILYLLSGALGEIGDRRRVLLWLYLVPVLLLLVMTQTRSAWAACFLLFVIYGLVYNRPVLIVVLVAPFLAFLIPVVSERLADLGTNNEYIGESAVEINSFAWRRVLWESAFPYIAERPLHGYGLESFSYYSPEFFPLEPTVGVPAHNVYVQLLFETGIMGLLSFLYFFWKCFLWITRHWHYNPAAYINAAACLSTILVTSFSDNMLEYMIVNWGLVWLVGSVFASESTRVPRRQKVEPIAVGISKPRLARR